MAAQTVLAHLPPHLTSRLVRIEYVDFQSDPDFREYRFAVHAADGPAEFRLRIASAAFGAGQVALQDGPDVCYQRLLRAVAAGELGDPGLLMIDDAELASYRQAHTPVPKHRPWTPAVPAKPPSPPRPPRWSRPPQRPVASPAAKGPDVTLAAVESRSAFGAGQRVSHTLFGAGVVASSGGGHTIVRFDEHGPRAFITSLVKLEVLSAPNEWEIGPRGKNRPREAARAAR